MRTLPEASGRLAPFQVVVYAHTAFEAFRFLVATWLSVIPGCDLIIVLEARRDCEERARFTGFANLHGSILIENLDWLGFSKSACKGLECVQAEYAVLCDPAATVTAGGICALVEYLRVNGQAEAAVPLTRRQLLDGLHEQIGTDPLITRFIETATLEMLATVTESSGVAVDSIRTVNSFDECSCFALRRSSSRKIAHWRFARAVRPESLQVAVTGSCYIDEPSAERRGDVWDAFGMSPHAIGFGNFRQALMDFASLPLGGLTVLFLLPDKAGAYHGLHSVPLEIVTLRECGMDARAATGPVGWRGINQNFPGASEFCIACETADGLAELAAGFDVVIATDLETARILRTARRHAPGLTPMYYLQDYEPWSIADDLAAETAEQFLTDCAEMHFLGSSEWLCRTMRQRHRIEVTRIPLAVPPNFGTPVGLPAPDASKPLSITCLVRAGAAGANAAYALRILRKVAVRYGGKVDIRVFGSTDEELDQIDEARGFRFRNLALLNRDEVMDVLRGADVFADISAHQAVGRLGLEAMSAGCAAILPGEGGAGEFAVDGQNCLLVDTSDEEEVLGAFQRLLEDRSLVTRLKEQGIQTARSHTMRKMASSMLQVLSERLCHAEK